MRPDSAPANHRASGLVEVLDRVLDKGLVVAGDIRISLAEVELLTIRIRLIVCSVDKAAEIGLDWWRYDRYLSPRARRAAGEVEALGRRIAFLEEKVALLAGRRGRGARQRRLPRPRTG
ncbi:MAG TPA: gas vesicle protein [Thermodesulfobacteriota bacterium]|nr:gas vesicle protein [Thermodesulfobacteriota bacterium]